MTHRSAVVAPATDWSPAVRARHRIGHSIEVHEAIGSTNDRARELLEDGADGAVVLAELQTEGRGRRGRTWLSPEGLNLTLSVGLVPAIPSHDAWQLGLATALATLDASSGAAGRSSLALKWPNDLVSADGRKVAGLLIETVTTGPRVTAAVLGIGINVNWRSAEMPSEIAERASSLADLAGRDVDRVDVLDRLLDALDREVVLIESGESPLDRYRAACETIGREVEVATAGELLTGLASDVDSTGSLVIDTGTGRVAVSSGEVLGVRPRGTG
jgi:BirA family transcriptional regulator, biotin operon repressor / biotin---[acetyl-CoA-carboxylase] ligase